MVGSAKTTGFLEQARFWPCFLPIMRALSAAMLVLFVHLPIRWCPLTSGPLTTACPQGAAQLETSQG